MQTHTAPARLLAMLGLDTHFHKCAKEGCNYIWSHRKADITSSEEHDAAHTCQKCGTQQTDKCEPDGSPLRVNHRFTEREVATILAALRNRQAAIDGDDDNAYGIASQNGRFVPMTANEIEDFGDKIHAGDLS